MNLSFFLGSLSGMICMIAFDSIVKGDIITAIGYSFCAFLIMFAEHSREK